MPDLRFGKALLWAVVLLAMLGVVVTLVAQKSEAVASLSVSISGDTQSASPGNAATFRINITNVLTATALSVNLTKSSAPTGWTAALSQTSFTLQALQTKSVTLTVGVPSNASADSVGQQIVVTATPDYGDTATITTTTKVSQVFGIQTSYVTNVKHTVGGSAVTFTLKINNTGNGQDTIALTHSGEPSTWTVTLSSSVTIGAAGSTDVTVSVIPPFKATASTYQTTIKATSSDGHTSSTASFIIIIDPQYGLSMSSLDVSKFVTPKVPAYYNLSVTNTGNTDDNAQISISSIPSGWTVLPTSNPVALSPNQTQTFQILVSAPSTALAGAQFQIKITATSTGNASISRELNINAVVNQIYDPRVTPIVNTKVVSPGAATTFKINVTNFGNGNDTVDLSLSGIPTGQGWVYNYNPTSVPLTPGQTKTIDLTFTIGPSAAYGDNQVTLKGTSHGTTHVGTATVVVSVSQFYNLALTTTGALTKRADPGGTMTFNFTVTNTGNGPDDISLSVIGLPSAWSGYFSKETAYNVPANGTQSTTLTLEIPSTTRADTYRFDVRATSAGNASVFRTIRNVTVIINQVYGVDIAPDASFARGVPVTGATVNITVTNTGTGNDTFTVSVPGQYATWVSFNRTTLRLGPGASGDVRATIAPPANTPVGTVSITMRATSKGKTSVFKEATVSFDVQQVYVPQLTAVDALVHKKPGEAATFSLQLKNAGNGADTFKVNFTLNTKGLASNTLASPFVTLLQGGTRNFQVTLTVPSTELVGDLRFVLLATSQNSSTSTSSVTLIVTVDPIYGLEMYSYSTNASAQPTDAAIIELRLDNTGNSVESYNMKATGPYYKWVSFEKNPISIDATKEGVENVTVTLPDDDVIAEGTYYINVTATSVHDATKTKTIELAITVLHKEDVELTLTDLIRARSTDPEGSVTYEVTVKNEGLKQHVVDVALTGAHTDWATLSKKTLVLAAGASAQVDVTVSVPKGTAPETFDITVTGSLDDLAKRTDSVVVSTTVNRINGLTAELNQTAASGAPGESVKVTLNINNTGNARDTFQLGTDAPKNWVVISPSSVQVDAGANVNVTVTVTPPLVPLTRAGVTVFNVTAVSKVNASATAKAKLAFTVEQVYSVLAKVSPASRSVDPGGAAVFNVTITNKGNGLDNFTFTVGGARKAWGKMGKAQVSIDAGKDAVVTLTVRIPANQPVETAVIWVLVSSVGDGTATANVTTSTTIMPYYGIELTAPVDTKTVFPGKATSMTVKVKNTGNANDVFNFDVSGTASNWVGALPSMSVGPGRVSDLTVNITPPSDAKNGQYTISINGSSDTQGDAFDIIVLHLNINVYHGLTATLDKDSIDSRPNATEHLLFSVKNTGNTNDTFDLRALGTYASWATLGNASLTAQPGATVVSTVTVRVPLNVTSGDYSIRFEARSRAGLNVSEVDLTIHIKLVYGAMLSAQRASTAAAPNSSIELGVALRNTGNTYDTFDLEVSRLPTALWDAALPFLHSKVAPGDVVYFNVTVQVPDGTRAGTYQVVVKATSHDAPAPAPFASIPLNVTISFAVSATGPDLTTTIAPGSYRIVQVAVKNEGLGRDTFTLKVDEPNSSWLTLEASSVTLGPGQTAIVDVQVSVPTGALAGTYTIKVRATSLGDRTQTATADVRVKVTQVYSVSIAPETVALSGSSGDQVQTVLTVTNLGNGDDTFSLSVRVPGGSRIEASLNATYLTLKAGRNATVKLTITTTDKVLAGTYDLSVDALSAGSAGASASSDVTFDLPRLSVVSVLTATGSPTLSVDGVSGQAEQFSIEVFNKGNAPDTYSLFVNSTKVTSWFSFEKTEVSIAPGESAVVQVTASVPASALSGAYKFDIVATSTRGSGSKALPGTINVAAYHDVALTADANSVTINPKAGQDAVFQITVLNNGNTREVVTLDIAGPTGWPDPTLDPESVTVDAFSTATITMTYRGVLVPAAAVESNAVTVKAVYASEESLALNLLVTVQKAKIEINPAAITFSDLNPAVGDSVTVTVPVRNTGVVAGTGLSVALLVNGVESTSITGVNVPAGGEQPVSLIWKVEEDAGSTPVIKVRVKETDLTVSASAVPTIKAAEGGIIGQITGMPFAYTLVIGLVIGLLIGLLIVVSMRRRSQARVDAARAAGVAEGMAMTDVAVVRTKPLAKPAPPGAVEKEEEEEQEVDEGDEGEEGAEGPVEGARKGAEEGEVVAAVPAVTVQCPRCDTINKVTTAQRPYEFRCKQCSALMRLSK